MSEQAILDHLLKEGRITRDDVLEAMRMGMDQGLNECADLMHLFLCGKEHLHDPSQPRETGVNYCLYYLEHALEDAWSGEAHQKWIEAARDQMKIQELSSSYELKQYLIDLRGILNAVLYMKERFPKGMELLLETIPYL